MIEKCYWEEGSRQQWIFYANDNSSLDGLSEKLIIDDVLCSSDEKIENLGIKRVNGKLYSGNYVGVCRIKSLNGKNITSIDGREVILTYNAGDLNRLDRLTASNYGMPINTNLCENKFVKCNGVTIMLQAVSIYTKGKGGHWNDEDMINVMLDIARTSLKMLGKDLFIQITRK